MCYPGWRKWSWDSLIEQVRLNCDVNPETGCWVWRGVGDKDGYPKLRIDGRYWRGNRAVLYAATGVLGPEGMHSCDTPPCMAPHHLRWGTNQDNIDDCVMKGRRAHNLRPLFGSSNGRSKLTEEQRALLVERSVAGEMPRELAPAFGVAVSSVQRILHQAGVSRRPGRPAKATA